MLETQGKWRPCESGHCSGGQIFATSVTSRAEMLDKFQEIKKSTLVDDNKLAFSTLADAGSGVSFSLSTCASSMLRRAPPRS